MPDSLVPDERTNDWLDRFEQAIIRVEAAVVGVQQARHRAEHRYRIVNDAGIETLAALDVLMAAQDTRKADAA